MKLFITLTLIVLTTNLFCQELKTIISTEEEFFDFGIEAQNDWEKRDLLLEDLANEKKSWDNLTEKENRLFEKYEEFKKMNRWTG